MRRAALACILAASACSHRAPPRSTAIHYVVGAPYELAGRWYYPRESFDYRATGLAERLPERTGPTADGEVLDATVPAAAHRTLQLPTIATVTALETGRQLRLRIVDRGPADPGRVLGLTRRAADLLGLPAAGAAQVRIEIESVPSQALRDRLQGGPRGIVAAPRGTVLAEPLAAPGGRPSVVSAATAPAPAPDEALLPDRLPDTVVQTVPQPGRLMLDAGTFSQARYADRRSAALSTLAARTRRGGTGGTGFTVVAGPFDTVAAADAALDQARAAGVTDAVIVVED